MRTTRSTSLRYRGVEVDSKSSIRRISTSQAGAPHDRLDSRGRAGQAHQGFEQPGARARRAAPRLADAVGLEHESAILAARGNHLDQMAGCNCRAHGMAQLIVDVAAAKSQLPRKR